jgi:hypothetical protein
MVQLEGLGELKNPMISSGIEPATFRLVELYLNQLQYRVPLILLTYSGSCVMLREA